MSYNVWRTVNLWSGAVGPLPNSGIEHFLQFIAGNLKGKRNRRGRHIIWMVVVWVLWITCNNSIFNGANVDLVDVVAKIKVLSWKWFANRKGRQCGVLYSEWCSNPVGCIMKRD